MRIDVILVGMTMVLLLVLPATACEDCTLGIFGNANEDETVNMQDVTYTELIILEYRDRTDLADAKYDGKINMQDVTQIELVILGKEKELTILDSADRAVTINKPIERMAVGFRFILETLRPLKVPTEMIVGVPGGVSQSDECKMYFPEYQDMPSIGNLWSPDIEAILSLNPDVVFMYYRTESPETTIDVLKSAGIPVASFASGVGSSFLQFGYYYYPIETKMLGYVLDRKDEAFEFTKWYESVIYPIIERAEEIPEDDRPKVYVESWNSYSISATHIDASGGKNIFEEMSGDVDPEAVVEQNPDIIVKVASTNSVGEGVTGYLVTDTAKMAEVRDEIMNRPELAKVNAVKNGDVYVISAYLTAGGPDSGPRNFIQIAYFAKWFQPEIFEELDPKAIHQEYLTEFQGLDIDLDETGVFVYPPLEGI